MRGPAEPPLSPSPREEQPLRTGLRLKEAREGLETEKIVLRRKGHKTEYLLAQWTGRELPTTEACKVGT